MVTEAQNGRTRNIAKKTSSRQLLGFTHRRLTYGNSYKSKRIKRATLRSLYVKICKKFNKLSQNKDTPI